MIVETGALHELAGRTAMVDGYFDPLHDGHIEHFAAAAELGLPVLCNLAPDASLVAKHPVLLPQAQRARVIDALRSVAYTHLAAGSTADVLRLLRPRYYAKGSDWRDRLPQEELEVCRELSVEIVFLDTTLRSSSQILGSLLAGGADRAPTP